VRGKTIGNVGASLTRPVITEGKKEAIPKKGGKGGGMMNKKQQKQKREFSARRRGCRCKIAGSRKGNDPLKKGST